MTNKTAQLEAKAQTQQVAPNNDLLPCPFCGDKPKFKTTFGRRHQAGIHQIACDCCGIRTRGFGNTDGARHYWNMRAR